MLVSAALTNGRMPTLAARKQRKVVEMVVEEEDEEESVMAVVSCVPYYDVIMRSLLEMVVDLSRAVKIEEGASESVREAIIITDHHHHCNYSDNTIK